MRVKERNMVLHIENPKNLDLPLEAQQVLMAMFADYRRITIRREFESGRSGARVFEVRPIKADGTPELPSITKLAAVSLIQKEWQAYQQHIRHRLPNTAEVTTDPVLLDRLRQGKATAGELAAPHDLSLPAISRHLRVLEDADLIRRRVEGRVHQLELVPQTLQHVDEWLARYRIFWNEQLDALARHLEGPV
jgi:DNA-binding transcriptional ArsR family regulator